MQALAKAERVVAADGDRTIDAQEFQVAQHVRREVEDAFLTAEGSPGRAESPGTSRATGPGWCGFVQEGAAGAVDGAHLVLVELAETLIVGRRSAGLSGATRPTHGECPPLRGSVDCARSTAALMHGFARYVTATRQKYRFSRALLAGKTFLCN